MSEPCQFVAKRYRQSVQQLTDYPVPHATHWMRPTAKHMPKKPSDVEPLARAIFARPATLDFSRDMPLPKPKLRPSFQPPLRLGRPFPMLGQHDCLFSDPDMEPPRHQDSAKGSSAREAQQHRATQPRARAAFKSTQAAEEAPRPRLVQAWLQILKALGPSSALFQQIDASRAQLQLVAKTLERFACSTIARYFQCWKQFLVTLQQLGISFATLSTIQLAETMVIVQQGRSEDRKEIRHPVNLFKAISWVAKHAEISHLQDALSSSLCRSLMFAPSKRASP